MEKICKNCKHFNFKVDAGNGAFGECLNPENIKNRATIISLTTVDFEDKDEYEKLKVVKEQASIYLNEDIMSCINFEANE